MVVCAKLVASLARPTVQFKTKYVEELTKSTIKAIRIILTVDGYRLKTEGEKTSIDHIVDLLSPLSEEQAVKAVKYLTAYQLPRLTGDVEPERPSFLSETATLFTHEYRRYIGRLYANHGRVTRRQMSLAFSILQIKRYLPPLPKSFKTSGVLDMKKRLTTPGVTPEVLLSQLARTVNEFFPMGWDREIPIPSYTVSNAACAQNSREQGGSQQYIFTPNSHIGECRSDQIIDFSAKPIFREEVPLPSHPNATSRKTFEETAKRTQNCPVNAAIEFAPKPLGLRAITKNDWQCGALKPLQKMVHAVLREAQPFRLIGEPLTEEIISCLDRFPKSKYVSGDYEAATDNFHKDATDCCIEQILGNMTGRLAREPELILLARHSLTGLLVSHKDIDSFIMTRGQLMGSLLSFPILCLVNFALWRHAREQTLGRACNGQGLGGREDWVLINGDDIGFCAEQKMYSYWQTCVRLGGLKPSLGKNYYCDEFITLNTLMFSYSVTMKKLTKIEFVNLGMLQTPGQSSLLENQDALGSMHDDFVRGCSDKVAASGIFISEHKQLLKMSWRNLYGPRELGGLGACPVKGSLGESKDGYSVRQLVIANMLDQGLCTRVSTGRKSRYSDQESDYIARRYHDIVRCKEEDAPQAGTDYTWEDVTDLVAESCNSMRSKVSWLAPYQPKHSGAWKSMNECAVRAELYLKTNGTNRFMKKMMSVSRYLEDRGEDRIYQQKERTFFDELSDCDELDFLNFS